MHDAINGYKMVIFSPDFRQRLCHCEWFPPLTSTKAIPHNVRLPYFSKIHNDCSLLVKR